VCLLKKFIDVLMFCDQQLRHLSLPFAWTLEAGTFKRLNFPKSLPFSSRLDKARADYSLIPPSHLVISGNFRAQFNSRPTYKLNGWKAKPVAHLPPFCSRRISGRSA